MQLWKSSDYSPRFRICQVSSYASVTHGSKYDWIWLNNGWINCYDYGKILNMLVKVSDGLEYACSSKCQGSESGGVVNMRGLHRMLYLHENRISSNNRWGFR